MQVVHDYSQPRISVPSQALVEEHEHKKSHTWIENAPGNDDQQKEGSHGTTWPKTFMCSFFFEAGRKGEEEEMCLNDWT